MTHSPVPIDVMEAAIAGNPNAITQVYHLTRSPLRTYVFYKMRGSGPSDIDDVVSETYMRMIRNLPSYQPTKDIMAWLYTIARNIIFDIAKSCRHKREYLCDRIDDDILQLPDAETVVVAHMTRSDLAHEIHACMSGITDKQRDVICCRIVHEMSIQQTADALDLEPSVVKSLQWRGIRAMSKKFHANRRETDKQWV